MKQHVLIVGLGLMGGSYAMGLEKNGYTVSAIDQNAASLEWAKSKGIIQQASLPTEAGPLVRQADIIVLALYPKDILPWLEQNHSMLKPSVMLTDLAGVKGCFVKQAQAMLKPGQELIACHPMAGKELSGIQNADDRIFENANFIITPTRYNTPKGITFAYKLAKTLGFGQVTELSVDEHDRMIGYVSQLTHAIAVSLMNANGDPKLPAVTGDSFRDLTRIADINGELWSELFLANAELLTQEIDDFMACLSDLRHKLAAHDKQGLKQLFERSTQRRRQFNKGTQ